VQKFSLENTDPILHKFGSKDVLSYLLFSNNLDMQQARETLIWISHWSISQSDRQEQACKISQVRCTLQFQQRNLMMLLVQLRELGVTDWSHFRSHNAEILELWAVAHSTQHTLLVKTHKNHNILQQKKLCNRFVVIVAVVCVIV